jgi:hypothetical protein
LGANPHRTGAATYFKKVVGTETVGAIFTMAAQSGIIGARFVMTGATSGAAITMTGLNGALRDIYMVGAYGGILVSATGAGVFVSSIQASGIRIDSGANGGYALRLEASGGATINDTAWSDVMIDQTSLGAAGIQLYGRIESFKLVNATINRTTTGISLDGASFASNAIPDYIKITNTIIDTVAVGGSGVYIAKGSQLDFTNVYIASPSYGFRIIQAEGVSIAGATILNCGTYGVFLDAAVTGYPKGVRVRDSYISRSGEGVRVAADVSDFIVQGNRIGSVGVNTGSNGQTYGVRVMAGASDRYIIAENLIAGNTTSGVTDGGTGVNKRVADNY